MKPKTPKDYGALAKAILIDKKPESQAAREAGFSECTIQHNLKTIFRSQKYVEALKEYGLTSHADIAILATGNVVAALIDKKMEPRTKVQYARLGLEMTGKVGQHAVFVQQNNFANFGPPPPMAAGMLARQLRKIRDEQLALGKWQIGDEQDVSILRQISEMEAISAPLADAQSRPPAIQLRKDEHGTFA